MTLTMEPKGEQVLIHKVTGRDDVRNHLADLGFAEGTSVCMINELQGNVIVNVKNTRIALDKALSNRIIVK